MQTSPEMNPNLIDKDDAMIVKLLYDHVAHRSLTRSRTSRNTYSIDRSKKNQNSIAETESNA